MRATAHRPRNPDGTFAPRPLADVLWSRVAVGDPDECWPWQGPTTKGYGAITYGKRNIKVHRAAWELTRGPIPAGMDICHTCDNRACCNPAHHFLGTHADNNADRDRKGRQVALRGSSHGNAKLTEDQVCEIIRRAAGGERQVEIARQFGVTNYTVHLILRGKTWRHVSGREA